MNGSTNIIQFWVIQLEPKALALHGPGYEGEIRNFEGDHDSETMASQSISSRGGRAGVLLDHSIIHHRRRCPRRNHLACMDAVRGCLVRVEFGCGS